MRHVENYQRHLGLQVCLPLCFPIVHRMPGHVQVQNEHMYSLHQKSPTGHIHFFSYHRNLPSQMFEPAGNYRESSASWRAASAELAVSPSTHWHARQYARAMRNDCTAFLTTGTD